MTHSVPPTYRAVLLDIEGTTTSISFVKDVLFPYASKHAENFLFKAVANNLHNDIVDALIQLSNEQFIVDSNILAIHRQRSCTWLKDLLSNVLTWITADKKLTALKKLQGVIWQEAYLNGEIKGHIYADVIPVFECWHSKNIPIFIFSSGSVEAQKLLFQYSDFGDLEKYLSGHFDTTAGPKTEASSYEKIATQISVPSNEILFVTDAEQEAFAADTAHLNVLISVREGNAPLSDDARSKFRQITSFSEL